MEICGVCYNTPFLSKLKGSYCRQFSLIFCIIFFQELSKIFVFFQRYLIITECSVLSILYNWVSSRSKHSPSTTAKVFVALLSLLSCLDWRLFSRQLAARLFKILEEPRVRRPRLFGLSSLLLVFEKEELLNCLSFSRKRTA